MIDWPHVALAYRERFWSKVEFSESCWLWRAATNEHGYGVYCIFAPRRISMHGERRSIKAHRLAWFFTRDEWLTSDVKLLHACDVPACVRPDHLRKGTQLDNIRDCIGKGRNAKGERFERTILTAAQVRGVLDRVGMQTQTSMARELGVSLQTINDIVRGRNWKHIPRVMLTEEK